MSKKRFLFNVGTSVLLGPVKYGIKLAIEPKKRGRNTVYLATSLLGAGLVGDLVEAATESGSDALGSAAIPPPPRSGTGLESGAFVASRTFSEFVRESQLETINSHLENQTHRQTGVSFFERNIALGGGEVSGVFPAFESYFNHQLPPHLYYASDEIQMAQANKVLGFHAELKPNLANKLGLTHFDIHELLKGQTPEGFTWHHHEKPGLLQLVDEDIHEKTAHTGGRTIWGGGQHYR